MYALRLYTGAAVTAPDRAPVEYVFTAPSAIPDDYDFEMIVLVTVSIDHQLTGLSSSIDALDYTQNGDTTNFWFKDFELVRGEDGTIVAICLLE